MTGVFTIITMSTFRKHGMKTLLWRLKALRHEINLNYVSRFISYLRGDAIHVHSKDETLNVA